MNQVLREKISSNVPSKKKLSTLKVQRSKNYFINSPVDLTLQLKRTKGNHAIRQLFKSGIIQTKLNIGQPNDIYEQEADRVADQVMSMPVSAVHAKSNCPCTDSSIDRDEETVQSKPLEVTPLVQRQTDEEEEKQIQTKRNDPSTIGENSAIESDINSLKGGGQPLPESLRNYFEPKFGYNFKGVRVYTGSGASETAKNLNAKAFTKGSDIVFGPGQYNPGMTTGNHLLAHELTHVVQQRKSEVTKPTRLSAKNHHYGREVNDVSLIVSKNFTGQQLPAIAMNVEPDTVQRGWPLLIAGPALVGGSAYALWAYKCLKKCEIPMYEKTFGSDWATNRSGGFRLWYYNQTRAPVPGRVWDAFGHCFVACCGTKRCGAFPTAVAGKGREYYREKIDSEPHDSYQQDTKNQTLGRSFGSQGKDCDEACKKASMQPDVMDLTAPLTEYWTPSRGDYKATPEERRRDAERLRKEARQREQRELEALLRQKYHDCLTMELERPGGVPSPEEEAQAREQCRQKTGYPQ
jgi:hypothetical protein